MQASDSIEEKVLREINEQDAVNLLKELVDIPSPTGEEKEIARYLAARFSKNGLKGKVQEVGETSANAIGMLEGKGEGNTLLFNGHLDTTFAVRHGVLDIKGATGPQGVGMDKDFRPEARVADGRVFGAGAMNMKGGLAAFTIAAEAIARSGVALLGDLVLTGVTGEIVYAPVDSYSEGWMRLLRMGTWYALTHGVTADMGIVAEPTKLGMFTGQAGIVWAKITTTGQSVNTVFSHSFPNPLMRMHEIVSRLNEWIPDYQRRMAQRYHSTPFLETPSGGPAVRISAIQGGSPWRLARSSPACSIYIDFRTKQPPVELRRELRRFLNGMKQERMKDKDPDFNYELEFYLTEHANTSISPDHFLPKTVQSAHAESFGAPLAYIGHTAMDSDGMVLAGFGVPSVTYGPGGRGSIGGGESVEISELVNFARSYARAAIRICNTPVHP